MIDSAHPSEFEPPIMSLSCPTTNGATPKPAPRKALGGLFLDLKQAYAVGSWSPTQACISV